MAQINIGTTANDHTGDTLRDAFGKVNDKEWVGLYDYNHSGGTQSFTGTPIHLLNNGAGANTNKTYGITGVSDIFDTTLSQFDFTGLSLGDIITIRVDMTVTTTTANQDIDIYLDVALGTVSNYKVYFAHRQFKTSGTYQINDVLNFVYMGNTDTLNNPAKFYFNSDANATVQVNGWANKIDIRKM